jgi:hypothetical protein
MSLGKEWESSISLVIMMMGYPWKSRYFVCTMKKVLAQTLLHDDVIYRKEVFSSSSMSNIVCGCF